MIRMEVSIIEEGFSIAGLLRLLLQKVQIWFLDKVKSPEQLVRWQILFVKFAYSLQPKEVALFADSCLPQQRLLNLSSSTFWQ